MIPYFGATVIPLGSVRIQVWGLMVAIGILTAAYVGARKARGRGLDGDVFLDFSALVVIASLIGARLGHAFFYEPSAYLADPSRLLRVWEGGMSSYGGFLGAAIGAAIFVKLKKIPFHAYADVAAFVLPLGYGIGRVGCFLIHDHPGTLSHFVLSVRYPGGARLDHGLLLSLVGFALFAWFAALDRRGKGEKGFLWIFMISYGIARFVLDFYRAWDLAGSDVRYFLLTPAQYGSLIFVIAGIWGFIALRYRSRNIAAGS